jgi:hypothetical protein
VSGLTFQEWTPDVDTSRTPVPMLINSRELCVVGFKLKSVIPPALETDARGGFWTQGAGLRSLEGMGPQRFILSVNE